MALLSPRGPRFCARSVGEVAGQAFEKGEPLPFDSAPKPVGVERFRNALQEQFFGEVPVKVLGECNQSDGVGTSELYAQPVAEAQKTFKR
jgi:hypothetical protein